jgi:hypothetical protein
MKKATAVLLNYNKKTSLKNTVSSIRSQSIPIEIILIDNSGRHECSDIDCDILLSSSVNLHCKIRFLISVYANTDIIFTLDDDVVLHDHNVIANYVKFLTQYKYKTECVCVDRDNHYLLPNKKSVEVENQWITTSYGKGRFLMFHKKYLDNIKISFHDFIDPKSKNTLLYNQNINQDNIVIDDIAFQKYAKYVLYPKHLKAIVDQPTSCWGCHNKPKHREMRHYWMNANDIK